MCLNRFLDIDSAAWPGLEETAGSPSGTHHVGPVRLFTCSLIIQKHALMFMPSNVFFALRNVFS